MMIKKNDYKNDPCDKEYIAEKGIISRISVSDSNGRKVPSEQELPDTGSIKDNKRKASMPAMRALATHVGSRWEQDLSKGKVSSVDVKNPHRDLSPPAHRYDLGRGELNSSPPCRGPLHQRNRPCPQASLVPILSQHGLQMF